MHSSLAQRANDKIELAFTLNPLAPDASGGASAGVGSSSAITRAHCPISAGSRTVSRFSASRRVRCDGRTE